MSKVSAEAAASSGATKRGRLEHVESGFLVGAPAGDGLFKSTESGQGLGLATTQKLGAASGGLIVTREGERPVGRALSKDEREALCLLFTDREQGEKEVPLSDQRLWERLLHSGSFDGILESIISSRAPPQDMRRGRPAPRFKEHIATILGDSAINKAETWSDILLTALGSDLVVEVLSLARPAAKATYLLQRVLLCRHLGSHPEMPFRVGIRSKGEHLHVDLAIGLNCVPSVRLLMEGQEFGPVEVSKEAEGVALIFDLPPSLDATRAFFGSLAIDDAGMPAFPNVAFRINRSTLPARESNGGAEDRSVSPPLLLIRAGRYLFSESTQVHVYLGPREMAPAGNAGRGAIWRVAKSQQVDGNRKLRLLSEDRKPLWSGNWSDIPQHPVTARPPATVRLQVGTTITVALCFDEEEAVELVVDGEVAPGVSPVSVQWDESFVRTLVFETPVGLLDGAEHRVAVRVQASEEVLEFSTLVRMSPTTSEWASLLQERDAVSLVRALSRMGRGGVVDDVLLSHGEGFADDLLVDILLARIADEGGAPPSVPVQDAFTALWLRMAKRPRGIEHLARRILATIPRAAASEEWRIIGQLPLKEALVDLAVLMHQIGETPGVRLASDVQTHLFRLGRYAQANQVPRNLSQDDQAGPEFERARLRNLRRLWDGEAAGLAMDMQRRKTKAPDVQRALVDNWVQEGRYLEAAAVSTEAQGVSRLLSRSTVHRRMARDTFPMGWVQWASPAFDGANDDAERTLSRLAGSQSPSVDGSISIFLTSDASDRNWPHRYFNDVEPAPALAMAASGETCGALPAITEWTLILHGGAPVSPESIKTLLAARLEHEDLVLIHQCAERADGPVIECGFMVRTKHLQFVSTMLPQAAASVLARKLRHRSLLVAREALPT